MNNQTTLLTELPLPLLIIRDYHIIFANSHSQILTGYTKEELEQSHLDELLAPDPITSQLLPTLLLESEGAHQQPLTLITHEGRECGVNLTATTILYEGQPATLCLIPELSAAQQQQQALHRQQRYTAELLDHLLDITLVLESDFTIRFVNPAITPILGYEPLEVVGRNYLDLIDMVSVPSGDSPEKMVWPDENTPIIMRLRHQKTGTAVYIEHILRDLSDDPTVNGIVVNARDITQRIQDEQERRYQAFLLENIRAAVFSTDRHGQIRSWNRAAELIYGYPASQAVGQPITTLLPHILPDSVTLTDLEKGRHWEEERPLIRPDGSQITIALSAFFLKHVTEESQGMVIMARDITKRQQAMEMIRLLEAAVEASLDGISIARADGDQPLVYVNSGLERMTGYGREFFLGHNCRFLQGSERSQPEREIIRQSLDREQRCQVILRNYRQDGSAFWNELTLSPIYDAEKKLTHFIGIQRNVTERILMGERVARQAQELTSLAHIGQTAVRQLDLNQVLTHLLHEIEPLYSHGVAIFLEEAGELVFRVVGGDIMADLVGSRFPATAGIAGAAMKTGQPQWVQTRAETQALLHHLVDDRAEKISTVLAVPLIIEGGAIGVLEAVHPEEYALTEDDLRLLTAVANWAAIAINNAQLYEAAQQALQKEQQTRRQLIQSGKLAAMGRMVATVAHELNNPLQTIRNCLFLIQKRVPDHPLVGKYLDMSLSEVDRLSKLVMELRDVYRPSQTEQEKPVPLIPLIHDIRALVTPHLKRYGVRWDWQPPLNFTATDPAIHVMGLVDQLKQVFLNVSLNAIESMANIEGGVLQVQLLLQKQPAAPNHAPGSPGIEYVAVLFADQGEGIAAEALDELFEPFYTSKETGMGLGLAISYDIIERHRGRIEVQSELGRGTTFTIVLPLLVA